MTDSYHAAIDHPTDKHGPRRGGAPIDMLVLHYTGLPSLPESLDALADGPKEVSAHYLIDSDGTILRLVPETRRAWHAGLSYWRGETDINSRSIGIELQHPDGNTTPFPETQVTALISLARDILSRHDIPARNVVGHSDIAPDRKIDPGRLFPWRRLAETGIGIWPGPTDEPFSQPNDTDSALASYLDEIGYDRNASTRVSAFQRRFRPSGISNRADPECVTLAHEVMTLCQIP